MYIEQRAVYTTDGKDFTTLEGVIMNLIVDGKPVKSFTSKDDVWYHDSRATQTINKILDTGFIAVYRKKERYFEKQFKYPEIETSYDPLYLLTSKGKLVSIWSSEWSGMEVINGGTIKGN